MRISDWSSDVCSSDLGRPAARGAGADRAGDRPAVDHPRRGRPDQGDDPIGRPGGSDGGDGNAARPPVAQAIEPQQQFDLTKGKNATDMKMTIDAMDLLSSGRVDGFGLMSSDSDFTRSEEHTSELQSLMRISYADLCLKKKK